MRNYKHDVLTLLTLFNPWNIFEKVSILDVWQDSEYVSANTFEVIRVLDKIFLSFVVSFLVDMFN